MGSKSGQNKMSLKIFHFIFILFTTLLFMFVGVFSILQFSDSGNQLLLFYSMISFFMAIGCVVYGKNFLNKYKNISNI